MKSKLDKVEKKIIASERNQPRIYLSKQESQNFDLARPVFVTIDQDDYSAVDPEVIDFFNIKLSEWFAEQSNVQYESLAKFIGEMMADHKFKEVFRGDQSIAYTRNDKFLNMAYPFNQEEITFPRFSFNDQIGWLWKKVFKSEKAPGMAGWEFFVDFQEIMENLYAGGLISAAIVAKTNGEILYSAKNWLVTPENLKEIISNWEKHAQAVTLNNEKFAMLNSNAEYFSAVNYRDKTYIIGAYSPYMNDERLFILAHTPSGVDGKQGYVEVVRAANRMKDEGAYMPPMLGGISKKAISLVKEEYEAIAALEKLIGKALPIISKIDFKSFGFIAHEKHVIALSLNRSGLKSLPESFWSLKHLLTLFIMDTPLESLPNAIENLGLLKELNISSNKLKSLPETMGKLRSLQILDARHNTIKILPESIGQLSSLKVLNLMSNQLTALPESIGKLGALQILNVVDNWLKCLPESITYLTGLKEFLMSANELTLSEPIKGFINEMEAKGCQFDIQQDEHVRVKLVSPPEIPGASDILKIVKRAIEKSKSEKKSGVVVEINKSMAYIIPFNESGLIEERVICLDLSGQEISNTLKYHISNNRTVNDKETESTIADAIRNVVRDCDVKIRRDLYDNVILIGDNPKMKNAEFKEGLIKEVKKLIPASVILRIIQSD